MIARDAQSIAHTPPLRRVDLSARPGGPINVDASSSMAYSPAECDRIMDLVRQTATGTNPPAQPEPSISAVDIANMAMHYASRTPAHKTVKPITIEIKPGAVMQVDVDSSGWEAA